MMSVTTVVYEVHASSAKELSDLFWNEVESNSVSIQNLVLQWLQLTQSLAETLQSKSASEKEKDAVLQFLIKLGVVKLGGAVSNQEPGGAAETKDAETQTIKDTDADVIAAAKVPRAAREQQLKQVTENHPETRDGKKHDTKVPQATAEHQEDIIESVQQLIESLPKAKVPQTTAERQEDIIESAQQLIESLPKANVPEVKAEHQEDITESTQQLIESLPKVKVPQTTAERQEDIIESAQQLIESLPTANVPEVTAERQEDITESAQQLIESLPKAKVPPTTAERQEDIIESAQHLIESLPKAKVPQTTESVKPLRESLQETKVPQATAECKEDKAQNVAQFEESRPEVKQEAVVFHLEEERPGEEEDDDDDDDADYDPADDVDSEDGNSGQLNDGDTEAIFQANEDTENSDLKSKNISNRVTSGTSKQRNPHVGLICHICQQTFDDPSQTRQHIKETHDIYKKHVCILCKQRFLKPAYLKCHMKTCILKQRERREGENEISSEGLVNNNDVSTSTLGRPNTRQKVRRERQSRKEASRSDDTATSSQSETGGDVDSSLHSNDDKAGLVCHVCQETFDDPSLTEQHIEETHKHVCSYKNCDQSYFKPLELQNHVKERHMGGNRKKCAICCKTFSKEDFTGHIDGCKEGSQDNSKQSDSNDGDQAGLVCHVCQETFDDPSLTEQHIEEMHDIYKQHVCTFMLCEKRFLKPSYLKNHVKDRHMGGNKKKCAVCFITFSREDFTGHIKECKEGLWTIPDLAAQNNTAIENDDDDSLKCHICHKTFDNSSLTKQHIKVTHDIYKQHVCKHCGDRFFKPFHLDRHVRNNHTGRVRKKCIKCFRRFNPENLSAHTANCNPEKFQCGSCDKQCFSAKALENHVTESHERSKVHKCSVCRKGYTRSHDLRRHEKIHDKVQRPSIAIKQPNGRTVTQCAKCLKIFTKPTWFKNHKCQAPLLTFPCKLCGQRCKTQELLVKHDNEFHKKIKTHFCDLCDTGFIIKTDLNRHVKMIHERAFECTCDICGKSFGYHYTLRTHRLTHMRDADPAIKAGEKKLPDLQCEKCGKLSVNVHRFKQHMLTHEPAKLKCNLCEKAFRVKGALKMHIEGVHLKVREKLCNECGAAFFTGAHLRSHINTVHKNYKPHVCEECGKGFSRRDWLRKHVLFHKKKKELKAKPRPTYPCDQCERVCSSRSLLANHQVSHSTERNFKCDQCGLAFKNKGTLASHKESVHLEKKYSCTECNKKFGTQKRVKKHIKQVHEGIKLAKQSFPCTFCNKVFRMKSEHASHKAWHQGLVKFKCETCGKEFSTNHSLTVHKKTHRNDGWRCNECGLQFKNQEQRGRHKAEEHLGLTDWNTCKQCGKTFTTHQSLRRHMKNHTGLGWKCAFCGEMFPTVYAKKKHATEVHSKSKSEERETVTIFQLA